MGRIAPAFPIVLLLMVVLLLGGCAGSTARFEALRDSIGLQQQVVTADGFRLLLLERSLSASYGKVARVYIEGDGRPWVAGGDLVAADPTPRKPLALELMAQDANAVLYLGRPCYFIGADEAPCAPRFWTSHRYSSRVVSAMAGALRDWLKRRPSVQALSLVGYSGGGVLALLIGEEVPAVREVIAVATPLDHARWTSGHAYSPLTGSLNVASRRSWRADVRRLVVFGGADENVPYSMMKDALPPAAEVLLLPGVSHECCGDLGWQHVLERADALAGRQP